MQTNVLLEKIIGDNCIYHYQNEIMYLTKKNQQDNRIHILQEQIDKVNTKNNKLVNNKELYNNHITLLKDVVFKKKWHQLKQEHKINRLKLYCNTHNIAEEQQENLLNYQNTIGFTSKDISYDATNGIINSINKTNIKIV